MVRTKWRNWTGTSKGSSTCLRLGASLLTLAFLLPGCSGGSGVRSYATIPQPADAIYYNTNVETMNPAQSIARAVAIRNGKIVAVGSKSAVMAYKGSQTQTTNLHNATVLPGFIDPHSHLVGYAFFSDTKYWTDVSSVNLYFKPLPTDPRCRPVRKCAIWDQPSPVLN